jgi:TM2 domain-containing membrane protein YozV
MENKKSWVATLLLCFFLGGLGAHRFYVGKIGTGIAMFLTAGGFGIWSLIDFIMIILGKFTDDKGNVITK